MIEQWIKSNVSSKHILIAAIILIGFVAFYNWVIRPHTGYLMAAQKYETVTAELAKKSQMVRKNVQKAKENLSGLQKKFEQFNTNLFDPNGADEFFGGIQNMAESIKCTVYSLNLPPAYQPSKAGGSSEVSGIIARRATLSIGGTYRNIIKVMNRLQERSERVQISSISIKLVDDDSDLLKCDMAVTVYVIRESEENPNG
jgi:hypothetical protein